MESGLATSTFLSLNADEWAVKTLRFAACSGVIALKEGWALLVLMHDTAFIGKGASCKDCFIACMPILAHERVMVIQLVTLSLSL